MDRVYILFNPSMPSLTRIGVLADGGDPADLMVELYGENVPLPFECVYACTSENSEQAMGALQGRFAEQEVGHTGLFFEETPICVARALCAYEAKDVTEEFRAAFDSTLQEDEIEARYTGYQRLAWGGMFSEIHAED